MLDLPEVRVADGVLAAVGLDHFAGFVDGATERQRLTHTLKRKKIVKIVTTSRIVRNIIGTRK